MTCSRVLRFHSISWVNGSMVRRERPWCLRHISRFTGHFSSPASSHGPWGKAASWPRKSTRTVRPPCSGTRSPAMASHSPSSRRWLSSSMVAGSSSLTWIRRKWVAPASPSRRLKRSACLVWTSTFMVTFSPISASARHTSRLPTFATQLAAQLRRVVDFDLLDAQLAVPHVELVQQRIGKRHELAEDFALGRAQFIAAAPLRQALLVLPGALARGAAEQEEVQHDAVQQRAQQPAPEQLGSDSGEFHQPETTALFAVGPVFAAVAHACHRRHRIIGARTNMPKNSRVCMAEMRTLSRNRRKCDRPSAG